MGMTAVRLIYKEGILQEDKRTFAIFPFRITDILERFCERIKMFCRIFVEICLFVD